MHAIMWKIDMPPLIANFHAMMPLLKWRIVSYCICRQLSSARTYQNLEENQSIYTELQSIFHKYADIIICKFLNLSSEAIMMTSWFTLEGQMKHEIISPIYFLSKYENEIEGHGCIPKELQWILYRHVFSSYMLCIKRARARGHLSWIDAHLVINGHKETNMVSICL